MENVSLSDCFNFVAAHLPRSLVSIIVDAQRHELYDGRVERSIEIRLLFNCEQSPDCRLTHHASFSGVLDQLKVYAQVDELPIVDDAELHCIASAK